MKKAFKILSRVVLVLTISILFNNNLFSQGFFDKLKKKVEQTIDKTVENVEKKIDNKVDQTTESATNKILNGESSNSDNSSISDRSNRPKLSELNSADFIQNKSNPKSDPNNTRYRVAKNLWIDIKGKYPNGYMPKWRFVSYKSNLHFTRENWIIPNSNSGNESKTISIVDYNGKALLRINACASFTGECFADIVIKDSSTVLTETPQTFELRNFRKILNDRSTGEPCCAGSNWHTSGGWAGKLTLSANENGDINLDLMLENYSSEHNGYFKEGNKTVKGTKPSQVAYRYTAKGITIENEMTAEKATEIVRKELEEKQRRKEYYDRCKKQIDELTKVIQQKYPQKECRECFFRDRSSSLKITPTKTFYTDYYGNTYSENSTDWDISNKLYIKNKCNYKLTFVGIKQLHSEEKGYYFEDVTATMDANYEYFVEQGMFSMLLSSMIGNNSDIYLQKEYDINSATLVSIQWIKVIRK